jgi:hypothetical protein
MCIDLNPLNGTFNLLDNVLKPDIIYIVIEKK